jgi:hypothetical protein
MKSLLGKLGVVLIGLAIFGCAEKQEGNWKIFYQDEDTVYYYNVKKMTHLSNQTVRVWVKGVVTEKFKSTEEFKKLTIKFPTVDHYMVLIELNCSERKGRILSYHLISKNKKRLSSENFPKATWKYFLPEEKEYYLYNAVCK